MPLPVYSADGTVEPFFFLEKQMAPEIGVNWMNHHKRSLNFRIPSYLPPPPPPPFLSLQKRNEKVKQKTVKTKGMLKENVKYEICKAFSMSWKDVFHFRKVRFCCHFKRWRKTERKPALVVKPTYNLYNIRWPQNATSTVCLIVLFPPLNLLHPSLPPPPHPPTSPGINQSVNPSEIDQQQLRDSFLASLFKELLQQLIDFIWQN